MTEKRGHQRGPPSRPHWKHLAYSPPSDFRVNLEAGLRTALSLGLTFLWLKFGPFQGGLSFFAGVTAIVCVGNTAGQTISRSLMMTHGALIGAICAILPRWLMKWGAFPTAAGFFAAIFLVLRSRRLTSLGKKFGSVGVTILILGRMSDDGLTASWWRFASSFVRVNVEGGFAALIASLFPYPRLATRDGALRAQFMCRSLAGAVDACVMGYLKARDEISISRARLLCLQVRHNLGVVRNELAWSRLELGLLCGGFCAGGLQAADALEELSELMEEVLQGVRGMRQSMLSMHRTRAQASFSHVVGSALREVSAAVDDTLEATSRRSALLPASVLACCHKNSPVPPSISPAAGSKGANGVVANGTANGNSISHGISNGNDNADIDEEKGLHQHHHNHHFHHHHQRKCSLRETAQRLEESLARLMEDYNRARKQVLYGLDEHGRPLEEAASAGDEEGGPGGERSSPQREPVPLEDLRDLTRRDLLSPLRRAGDGEISTASTANGVSGPAAGIGERMPVGGGAGGGTREGHSLLGAPSGNTPNHVLVMKERQRLGGSATMARGAFLFSLAGLCAALTKERVSHTGGWRPSHTAEAACFVLAGLWKAVRPPPGLVAAGSSSARLAAGWFWNWTRSLDCCACCSGGGGRRRRQRERKVEAKAALKRLGSGIGLGSPAPKTGVREEGTWWASVTRSGYFWCFKVSLTLTLCAAFSLSPFLADLFEPPMWIAVTASFVMENQSASAVTTCLLRLIGTVLGAVYGILAAKLSTYDDNNPFSFQAHATLLPWVAVTCFFRNSSQFSYAALVAAFTAVVIFTGSNTVLGANGEAVSLARIVNTVVGSVIYLMVDMLLIPTRAKGLVLEQVYLSLDAAFQEVSVDGERMFGPAVCPQDSRALFLKHLSHSRARSMSRSRNMSLGLASYPPRPPPPPRCDASQLTSRVEDAGERDETHRTAANGNIQPGGGGEASEGVRDDGGSHDTASAPAAGGGAVAATPAAAVPVPAPTPAPEGGGESWGSLPAVGELLPAGFASERGGFLDEEAISAGEQGRALSSSEVPQNEQRRRRRRPVPGPVLSRTGSQGRGGERLSAAAEEDHEVDDDGGDGKDGEGLDDDDKAEGAAGGAGGRRDSGEGAADGGGGGSGGSRRSSRAESVKRWRTSGATAVESTATAVMATAWRGRQHKTGCLQKMVKALALQKHYLPLAELEPQLWYEPFPASAYQGMVVAQEELLRALTLLTKAAIAISEDRSTEWRRELTELGSHLASLVQLLKIALEEARDVFGRGKLGKPFTHWGRGSGDDLGGGGGGDGGEEEHGMRMLDVHADAMRLDADVQNDFVSFIQAFMDRGAFPVWELESILRINTAVVSVMGVQKALLTLGHEVATVIDRESYGSFYR